MEAIYSLSLVRSASEDARFAYQPHTTISTLTTHDVNHTKKVLFWHVPWSADRSDDEDVDKAPFPEELLRLPRGGVGVGVGVRDGADGAKEKRYKNRAFRSYFTAWEFHGVQLLAWKANRLYGDGYDSQIRVYRRGSWRQRGLRLFLRLSEEADDDII